MIKKIEVLLTGLVVAFFGIFYYLIFYYQLPIGDDVLMQFSKAISFYLDIPNPTLGERITNFPTIVDTVSYVYKVWSGRLIGHSLIPLLTIFGRKFTASFTAVVFLLIIFNISALIENHKDIKMRIFSNPVRLIFLNLMIFVLGGFKGTSTMWVMVSIYGVATLLHLFMLNITYSLCKNEFNSKLYYIIFLNLFGFVAGLSHEVIGAVSIGMIFIKCFEMFWKKRISFFKILSHYIGLILGYFICFTAPGNFVRMNSSHDATIKTSLITRIHNSLRVHYQVISEYKIIFRLIIIIILICIIVKLMRDKVNGLKMIIINNYLFILGVVFSISIWGFASYVPQYGLLFYMCLVCIIIFRVYDECTNNKTLNLFRFNYKAAIPSTLILLVVFFLYNYSWVSNLCKMTLNREQLINTAKNNLQDTVVVPAYSDINNLFYRMDHSVNEFDAEYYIKYYGVHIIIRK